MSQSTQTTTTAAVAAPTSHDDGPAGHGNPIDAPVPHVSITPPGGWVPVDWHELWRYRELLWFFTLRDIKARYKQTLLGPFWVVVMPLLSAGLFSLVFGVMAGLPSGDVPYPVFVYSGMLIWQLFAKALTGSSNSLRTNQHLITKVYFPRLIVPAAAAIAGVLDFVLGFGVLVVLLIIAGLAPGWAILALPLYVLLAMLAGLAVGLWISALGVRFRDVGYGAQFLVQAWMWLTPVAYSSEIVFDSARMPPSLQTPVEVLFQLNPMYVVVEGFRWSMFSQPTGQPTMLTAVSAGLLLLVLFTGLLTFRKAEHTFADLV